MLIIVLIPVKHAYYRTDSCKTFFIFYFLCARRTLAWRRLLRTDDKGYIVDDEGYNADDKGYIADDKDYSVDDKGCSDAGADGMATFALFEEVPLGSEDALQKALSHQPVSVAVNAKMWQFYHGGVFNGIYGICNGEALDHGVLAVGMDTTEGYYIVKVRDVTRGVYVKRGWHVATTARDSHIVSVRCAHDRALLRIA
eukprot:1186442-Prorocentrum_minimum.AAC.1